MITVPRRAVVVAAFATCFSLCASAPTRACLNDRDTDTLAEENRALPGMVEVITGRFERNPPLYYRMRIARVEKEIGRNPTGFPLYDDIAVAHDRLGESDKALEWMTKKREQLEIFSPQPPGVPLAQLPDRWYRYYANTGTFRVHRWLHDGADRKRIAEVKQARAEIAKAIAIKPDAHFGRETYQLQAMDWIIADGKVQGDKNRSELGDHLSAIDGRPITEGLAGLVVLGNAWESVDVFTALGRKLVREESGVLGYLAALRATELADKGKKSLFSPLNPDDRRDTKQRIEDEVRIQIPSKERLPGKYGELRTEAETWQTERTGFMMRRLNAGRHPDTDSHFWNGYSPKSAPSLSTGAFAEWSDKTFTARNILTAIVVYIPLGIVTFFAVRGIIRMRRQETLDY